MQLSDNSLPTYLYSEVVVYGTVAGASASVNQPKRNSEVDINEETIGAESTLRAGSYKDEKTGNVIAYNDFLFRHQNMLGYLYARYPAGSSISSRTVIEIGKKMLNRMQVGQFVMPTATK